MLVAFTGYTEPERREKCSQAGFDQFLIKPASFEQLCDIIDEASRRFCLPSHDGHSQSTYGQPQNSNGQPQQAGTLCASKFHNSGFSEAVGTRTQDLRIKSPLLYQLSYGLKLGSPI